MHKNHRWFPQLLLLLLFIGCTEKKKDIPYFLIGNFQDDYKIEYQLSQDRFILKPSTQFHIISWNKEEQYFIAKNDSSNSYDPNLYSRIDWIKLSDMLPYEWAFCLSAYDAPSIDSAKAINSTDSSNPKTGCNGYPFSRMKKIKK